MSKDMISKVLDVDNLANYQKGSVVSQEIVRKEAGTLTIFAFDEGEGLSTHSAPFDAVVQVVDGKAKITIDDVDNIVEKGQMIIMPANIPHALMAIKPFKMILTMIKSEN